MTTQYRLGFRLKGIIFLHRINEPRIGSHGLRLLELFTAMWGYEALPNIALVSTMWTKVDRGEALRRETEMRGDIWKNLAANGASMFQYNDSPEMAETIVSMLTNKRNNVVLRIQRELMDKKPLKSTSAGKLVHSDIEKRLDESRKTMRSLEEGI